MSGRNFAVALLLSTSVHIAVLAKLGDVGDGGSNAPGESRLSLSVASNEIVDEVAKWETQPEIRQEITPSNIIVLEDMAPKLGRTDERPATAEIQKLSVTVADIAPEIKSEAEVRSGTIEFPDAAPTIAALKATRPAAIEPNPLGTSEMVNMPPETDFARETERIKFTRPKSRPKQPSGDSQIQKVTRVGGKSSTASRPIATSVYSSAEQAKAQARWAAEIQRRIAREQRYPRDARVAGRVKVSMKILASGGLDTVGLATSSGASELDRAAILAVRRAAPFPPAPKELTDQWFRVSQWITFNRR